MRRSARLIAFGISSSLAAGLLVTGAWGAGSVAAASVAPSTAKPVKPVSVARPGTPVAKASVAHATDVVKLKVPILGSILSKTAIARFTRTLGTLISAGVPILDAINITRETSGNEVYSRALLKVHDAIREGESMADPLRATKVCDAIVVNMIDVGEETGDLDKMLIKVADNYDNDVDVLVGSLISILEPVMVVVLGVIVGFIMIALFMPMISLIQGISGSGSKK